MKLIIDIPAETYAFVKQLQMVSLRRGNCKTIQQTVINSIKLGVKYPQGEWIEHTERITLDTYYECSNCKEPWTTIEGTPMQNLMNFCPNCGAKMGGGADNV